MDYQRIFSTAVDKIKAEGRYRVFIDIARHRGDFPLATRYRGDQTQEIVVWCSNDYLGMGQSPVVIDAMDEALQTVGANDAYVKRECSVLGEKLKRTHTIMEGHMKDAENNIKKLQLDLM